MSSPVEHLARGPITRPLLRSCSFITLTELIYGLLQRNMYLHDSHQGADSVAHRESGRESHGNWWERHDAGKLSRRRWRRAESNSRLGSTFTTWQCGASGKVKTKQKERKEQTVTQLWSASSAPSNRNRSSDLGGGGGEGGYTDKAHPQYKNIVQQFSCHSKHSYLSVKWPSRISSHSHKKRKKEKRNKKH